MAEKIFFTVSSAELIMGLLDICNVILPFSRFILWGFLVVYTVVMLMGHYSNKEKLLLAGLLFLGVLLYINSGLNIGIKAPVYLYALKNEDIRKYCKISLIVLVVSFLGIMMASIFAGFGNLYMMDIRSNRGFNGLRYCLGFSNPNKTMAVALIIMLLFLHLYSDKIKWYTYFIIAGIYTLLYYLTDCRTAFFLGIFILILSFCFNYLKWDGWNRVVFILFLLTFLGMLLISILAAFHYESGWMERINHFISGRMSQLEIRNGSEDFPLPYVENWHLFGSRLNKNFYDLGYVQIFYYYGIIPALCYLLFVFYAAVMAWKDKKTMQIVLLIGFCVYLFMESMYFSNYIPINFLLIYSAVIVFDKSQCELPMRFIKQ